MELPRLAKKRVAVTGGNGFLGRALLRKLKLSGCNVIAAPRSCDYDLVDVQAVRAFYRQQHGFNGVVVFPVNLYGPEDNFDLETSHVIPAMIRKFVTAVRRSDPEIVLWGEGSATREFLFVEDAAEGILGQPRRQLDVHRAAERFGFHARTSLEDGLAKTMEWFLREGKA